MNTVTKGRGKYPTVLGVRLPPGVAEQLARKAEADDRTACGYARKLILDSLLRADDPKTGAAGA